MERLLNGIEIKNAWSSMIFFARIVVIHHLILVIFFALQGFALACFISSTAFSDCTVRIAMCHMGYAYSEG